MRHSELKLFASHAVSNRIRFRFLHMRDTDNSGVIKWIIENVKGENKIVFQNCQSGADPFLRFPQAMLFGELEGVYQRKAYIELLNNRPDYLAEVDGFFFSYENIDLADLDKASGIRLSAGYEEQIERNVYILHDFTTWFASCWVHLVMQFGSKELSTPQPILFINEMLRLSEMWKKNLIRLRSEKFRADHSLSVLRYDKWICDPKYRHNLIAEIDLDSDGILTPDIIDVAEAIPNWEDMMKFPQFSTVIGLCFEDIELRDLLRDEFPDNYITISELLNETTKTQVGV